MEACLLKVAREGDFPGLLWLLGSRPAPARHMGSEAVGSWFDCGSHRITRQMATSSVAGKVVKSR